MKAIIGNHRCDHRQQRQSWRGTVRSALVIGMKEIVGQVEDAAGNGTGADFDLSIQSTYRHCSGFNPMVD